MKVAVRILYMSVPTSSWSGLHLIRLALVEALREANNPIIDTVYAVHNVNVVHCSRCKSHVDSNMSDTKTYTD